MLWQDSQKFDTNLDGRNDDADAYVDLLDWCRRVRDTLGSDHPTVREEAQAVIEAVSGNEPLVRITRGGGYPPGDAQGDLEDAGGLSIFYSPSAAAPSYREYVTGQLFAFTTAQNPYELHWDDLLREHRGAPDPSPVQPYGPSRPLHAEGQRFSLYLPLVQKTMPLQQ
ncbi:MAG: hypothetical protein HC884_04055 [Chloroflexaceae bacterium]|nr:hypothetical protein [Chloroflexaceae bacterium]